METSGDKRLAAYRAKRDPARTPEPFGDPRPAGPSAGSDTPGTPGGARIFVVQKHAARALHYDLRLEVAGVLRSWAVPKGPHPDPAEKRLAVETEDHPLEYARFEGTIPEGEYGAGEMIVWDRGTWTPAGNPAAGVEAGKLLFDLHGYKLRGRWTLVRLKKKGKNTRREWLLVKERDEHARPGSATASPPGAAPYPEESILSGLTVEELRDGRARAAAIRAGLARAGAKPGRVPPGEVDLMLADVADRPFSGEGWLFEIKYDGFRLTAAREPGRRPALHFRRGAEATAIFPEIEAALAALPTDEIALDGEIVVLDETGRPSFQGLQKRLQLRRTQDIERAALERPATYFVFDLLAFEGLDVRPLPLAARKEHLRRLLPRTGPVRFADHIEREGERLYAEAQQLGLEGIVAKRADAPYRGGRSSAWLKLRHERTGDFAIVGYTLPESGARTGFGALHLGGYRDGKLIYAGRAGTGFDERELAAIFEAIAPARLPKPACTNAPRGRGHVWVEPRLCCEVRYREWTEDGLLRLPAFLRLRPDKRPEDCALPASGALRPPAAGDLFPGAAGREPPAASLPRVRVEEKNRDKVFWPDEGYRKGDLLDYYRAIGPWIIPYLRDRPLVLTRFPDGIAGKSFFQKDARQPPPPWIRAVRIHSESAERDIDYFVCDDVESLIYVVNLGTIPLHVWASRVASIAQPDWCVLDLDPKGAPFAHVVELALAIRRLCDAIGLPSFPKTSGSSGIHVFIPLGGACTYDESRSLGELLARVIERERPAIATTERVIEARGGRVYIDYVQNGHGRLIVAPFSARPLPGATVSTPLAWDEVGPALDPKRFTIKTVPARMATLGADPMRPVLEMKPDIAAALGRLGEIIRQVG